MSKIFIETTDFSKVRSSFLSDEDYEEFKKKLADRPEWGDVMPGCGGLRKLRIADPKRGKGKRGGARLIYLHIPQIEHFLLLEIYGKNEKEDLSNYDKKTLKQLAQEFRQRIIRKITQLRRKDSP
jgi:mRNA-degrading endonuclease RelE of RelBE toxin-antitoxin system